MKGIVPMQYAFFGADGRLDLKAFASRARGRGECGPAAAAHPRHRRARARALLRPRDRRSGHSGGIQNAPEYIGIGLGVEAIVALARNHPNFRVLKMEGSAMLVRRTIEETGGALTVLNGRAGLELPDNRRAGVSGMIPGAEVCDVLVRVWDGLGGDPAAAEKAEALYREVLPLLTFIMQSMDQFLCYGKRLIARRLGLGEVHDRAPAQAPTAFGLNCLERHAARLGPWR
jgi:2-keto-3-deoxy-L-arabinonate dehydratase